MEKDSKHFEKTIVFGKPSIVFSKFFFNFSISMLVISVPLYNILSEDKGKAFIFIPSYKVFIYGKYFLLLLNLKSLFKSL